MAVKSEQRSTWTIMVVLAIALGLFVAVRWVYRDIAKSIHQANASAPVYRSRVISIQPTNPGTVRFAAIVTNTGKSSGSPECTVQIASPGDAYIGTDIYDPPKLAPGHSETFYGLLVISGNGAAYVTRAASTSQCAPPP